MSERTCIRCGAEVSYRGRGRPPSYCSECRPTPHKKRTPEQILARRKQQWPEAFALVVSGRASRQVAECVALVEQGLGITEIARELGLAKSTVHERLKDPTGEASNSRKRAWEREGRCVECGSQTARRSADDEHRCWPCYTRIAAAAKRARFERLVELRREGLNNHQIAERLTIPVSSVATLLHRGRRRGWTVPRSPYWERKAAAA